MNLVPLLAHDDLAAVFAWRSDGPVSVGDYLADVHALAEQLPAAGYLLNLCHDRYRFAVGFAAGLLRGMTSLQPSSQSPETFRRLRDDYPALLALCDGSTDTQDLPRFDFPELAGERNTVSDIPRIPAEHLAAILFTSGSTGLPQAQRKTWGKLAQNGRAKDLPAVIAGFEARYAKHAGVVAAEVVSAQPLDAKQVAAITAALSKSLGKAPELTARVDPSILGGLKVKVGSKLFDASLKTKLDQMKFALKRA